MLSAKTLVVTLVLVLLLQPALTTSAAPALPATVGQDGSPDDLWMSIGPQGGAIRATAMDPLTPTTLYASTPGGLYKSSDGGAHWALILGDLYGDVVESLAVDPQAPNIVYLGTQYGQVMKSTDSGSSWSLASNGLPWAYVYALTVHPHTPSTVFAATFGAGLYVSTDSGGTWNFVPGVAENWGMVSNVIVDPVTTTTLYATTWLDGVFKSTDGGVYNGRQKLDRETAGVKVQYRSCANNTQLNLRHRLYKKS